jgi:hypothetical protein
VWPAGWGWRGFSLRSGQVSSIARTAACIRVREGRDGTGRDGDGDGAEPSTTHPPTCFAPRSVAPLCFARLRIRTDFEATKATASSVLLLAVAFHFRLGARGRSQPVTDTGCTPYVARGHSVDADGTMHACARCHEREVCLEPVCGLARLMSS